MNKPAPPNIPTDGPSSGEFPPEHELLRFLDQVYEHLPNPDIAVAERGGREPHDEEKSFDPDNYVREFGASLQDLAIPLSTDVLGADSVFFQEVYTAEETSVADVTSTFASGYLVSVDLFKDGAPFAVEADIKHQQTIPGFNRDTPNDYDLYISLEMQPALVNSSWHSETIVDRDMTRGRTSGELIEFARDNGALYELSSEEAAAILEAMRTQLARLDDDAEPGVV